MISKIQKRAKRLLLFFKPLLLNLARDLEISPIDVNYVLLRLKNEGVSFLTKTLPIFSKFTIHIIEHGPIHPSNFDGASAFAWKRNSPAFLQVYFNRALSGCSDSLYKIRQFCEYFYKTAFGFEKQTLIDAANKYIGIENEMSELRIDADTLKKARSALLEIFPRLCSATAADLFTARLHRDGPGSCAKSKELEREFNVPLNVFKTMPTDIIGSHRKEFSAWAGTFRAYPSSKEAIKPVEEDRICELLFVPKDSRGPRTISKEPYFLLKAQMGFNEYVTPLLESMSDYRINFRSQTLNQELCFNSSIHGKQATLDLKDASDRISMQLLRGMFKHMPLFEFALKSLRSTHVRMPNGDINQLVKFANMGSGLCFPVLALCVFIAATLGVKQYYPHLSYKDASKYCYVYGDDLIIPTNCFDSVVSSIKSFGLAVNTSKSFKNSSFRESCGADFFNGKDVAPVRFRMSHGGLSCVKDYTSGSLTFTSNESFVQLERHARELYNQGLYNTQRVFIDLLETRFGRLPTVSSNSGVFGCQRLGEEPSYVPIKAYNVSADLQSNDSYCSYKALGKSFASKTGLQLDPSFIPKRGSLIIRKKVINPSELHGWGLSETPFTVDFTKPFS